MTVHRLMLELVVDDEIYDLREHTQEAMREGWGDDPDNGMTMLADEIAISVDEPGLKLNWVV